VGGGRGTINGLRCSGDVASATDDQLVVSRAGGQTTPKEAEVEWRLEAAAKHDRTRGGSTVGASRNKAGLLENDQCLSRLKHTPSVCKILTFQ
jgi:hypothetical protein